MVEKVLVEYSYDIDEEIIKESNGFVHKMMSNDDSIVKHIEKASKDLEKELGKAGKLKIEEADEKLRPLLKVFSANKGKISYSYDVFENGVIRVFETGDDSLVESLHDASDSLATTDAERSGSESSVSKAPEETGVIEEWDPEKERAEDDARLTEMERRNQEAVDEESQ